MSLIGLAAHWAFNEESGMSALDAVSGIQDPVSYIFNEAEFVSSRDPEWRTGGVSGGALLFDGYSTYITRKAAQAPEIYQAFTVSVWVAPRSFEGGEEERLSAIVNRHDREKREGFAFGLYRHGSWSLQLGIGGEWIELWDGGFPVPSFQWSHLAATFDAEHSTMKLYLNGQEIAVRSTPAGVQVTPCGSDLYIGRNNQAVIIGETFSLNMFDGLMDELKLYDRALTAEEINQTFLEDTAASGGSIPSLPYEQIRLDRTPFKEDRHRPQFHAGPPAHWMNEPHAPMYFNGQYHLFYQHNPRGPYFHQIHWGHWVSDDLVHWRDLPVALAPEKDTDPDGIWTGSATTDADGLPVLFYTAGDHRHVPNQWVAAARSTYPSNGDTDLVVWQKDPDPLVKLEPNIRNVRDFRDPYVWKEDGVWYMLVGSATEEEKGTAYAYVSRDMKQWEFKGTFYDADHESYPFLGPIWELPVILPLGSDSQGKAKHVFLVSPVGPGSDVEIFYWIGTLDKTALRFIPDSPEPQLIDVGDFKFTGPSGMVDPVTGRSLLFTICQGDRSDRMQYLSGWAHSAGLPIRLYLREDGRLGIEPIEELKSLRAELLAEFREESLDGANERLKDIRGDMLELRLEIEPLTANRFGLKLRRSPGGEEETFLYYDKLLNELGVDRKKTSLDPREQCGGVQGGRMELGGETLMLHVYLDRSIVEGYANGRKSVTTRVYPSRSDALGLQLWGDGTLTVKSMEVWKLNGIYS